MNKRKFFEKLTLSIGCALLGVGSVVGACITDLHHVISTTADGIVNEDMIYDRLTGSVWESKDQYFDSVHFPYAWGGLRGGVVMTTGTFYWSNVNAAYGRTFDFYGISFNDTVEQLWLYRTADIDADNKFAIPYADFQTYSLTLNFTGDSVRLYKGGVPSGEPDVTLLQMFQGLYDNFDLVIPPDDYDGALSLDDARNEVTSLTFFNLFEQVTSLTSTRYLITSDLRSNIYHGTTGFTIPTGSWYVVLPYRIEFTYSSTGSFTVSSAEFLTYSGNINSLGFTLPFAFDCYRDGDGYYLRSWQRAFAPVIVSGTLTGSNYGADGYNMCGNYGFTATDWALDCAGFKTFYENYYLPEYFAQTDPVYYAGRALVLGRPEYNNSLWNSAYNQGYYTGYRIGYIEGQNSVSTEQVAVISLFGAIVNVPITVLNGLSGFTIWNVPIVSILFTFLFIALFAWVIKRFI